MEAAQTTQKIQAAIAALSEQIDALAKVGAGIPAVEKNMIRMRGTLRALEVQFSFIKPRQD